LSSILGIKKVDFCVDKFYLIIKIWWWLFWISIFSKKNRLEMRKKILLDLISSCWGFMVFLTW
jgi:hypothetical protein